MTPRAAPAATRTRMRQTETRSNESLRYRGEEEEKCIQRFPMSKAIPCELGNNFPNNKENKSVCLISPPPS